jgi:hypothetical protein
MPFLFALPSPGENKGCLLSITSISMPPWADHARLQRNLFLEQIGVDRQRIPADNPGNGHDSFQDSLLGSLPEVTSVL